MPEVEEIEWKGNRYEDRDFEIPTFMELASVEKHTKRHDRDRQRVKKKTEEYYCILMGISERGVVLW